MTDRQKAELESLRAQVAGLKAENERLSIRSELNADALADSRMFCDMKKIECRQLQEERAKLTRQRDEYKADADRFEKYGV